MNCIDSNSSITHSRIHGKMNAITLEHFSNKRVNGTPSHGIYIVKGNEILSTIAIDCADHTESHDKADPNNFGMVELHDMEGIRSADLSFNLHTNRTAMRVPALNSVCVDLDGGRQIWIYCDEDDRKEFDSRLVQLVQNGHTQYMQI